MARVYYNQEQFNFGLLGKTLRARRDAAFYRAGAKVMKNFRPTVQGPAIKRKGTRFIAETKDSSVASRLIPFKFSATTSFHLEFGNGYIRFFQNGDSVFEATQSITAATQANPVVVTITGHGYSNGDEVRIESVEGMIELNDKRYRVANVTANTFELTDIDGNNIDGTAFSAYVTGGTAKRVYEIASPYSTSDLSNLKYDQLGDIMYIAAGGKSVRPQKLVRSSATSWTISDLDNQLGPVEDFNETGTTITLSATLTKGGTSTWTASSGIFQSAHVGSVWAIAKHDDQSIIGYARMASFSSSTVATFTNQTDLTPVTTTASTNWKEATWSGVKGYPKAVAFHESRLFWGGVDERPLVVVGSTTGGAYENYDIDDASADDGLIFDLVGQINDIQWLTSDGDFLVGGTLGGLSFIRFDITDTTITPRARVGSSYGASSVQGAKINNQVIYLHNSNKSLYETQYDDILLKYRSTDLNDFNPDILGTDIQYLATVEQPDNTAIMPSGGDLKLLSRDTTQSIAGWYEFTVNGDIESVSTAPNTTGEDEVYLVIERTINGATRRYVEQVDQSTYDVYMDSSIVYDGAATRTVTGLDHLEGETVGLLGDNAYYGDFVVSGGSVTVPSSKPAFEEAIVGHEYNADLEIMPIDVPLQQTGGTSQTIRARIDEIVLILSETVGLQVGRDVNNLETVPFRSTSDNMDTAVPKFGLEYPDELKIPFNGNWTRAATVYIRSNLPLPCTVVSLMARLQVEAN
ncbi:MAG: hypothetical protein MI745_14055 [Pseudomonadales bacterium]|nr:hypothetical protein [Pseudomonadales bacterium]